MTKLCPECGANPCYLICPTQDPYQGNQAAEAADHDFNAQFDDVRERYAGEIDPEYEARCADMDDESPEGFRPNDDGTVTYISPTGGEHTYDPADVFKDTDDSLPF